MKRILIIDKHNLWARLVKRKLYPYGCEVDIVHSNQEGIAKAEEYDLIIVEYNHDRSFHEILRKHPVVVSAVPDWREGREVYLQGAIDYTCKSSDVQSLLRIINEDIITKKALFRKYRDEL